MAIKLNRDFSELKQKCKSTVNINNMSVIDLVNNIQKSNEETITKQEDKIDDLERALRRAKMNELNIVENIVEILDEFENVLNHYERNNINIYNDLLPTKKKINRIVREIGVNEISSRNGEYVVDRLHAPVESVRVNALPNQIYRTIRKGYEYKGEIIREAEVISTI